MSDKKDFFIGYLPKAPKRIARASLLLVVLFFGLLAISAYLVVNYQRTVNNGVYRAGFASTQSAYETAAREVFDTLDRIDAHLGASSFLVGDRFTEADLRLFPTLARFDVAYHYAFRCNLRRLSDYRYLWPYARHIFQMPGVAETVKFDIYKRGYFSPSEKRNPLGIVPIGPEIDWTEPHGR